MKTPDDFRKMQETDNRLPVPRMVDIMTALEQLERAINEMREFVVTFYSRNPSDPLDRWGIQRTTILAQSAEEASDIIAVDNEIIDITELIPIRPHYIVTPEWINHHLNSKDDLKYLDEIGDGKTEISDSGKQ